MKRKEFSMQRQQLIEALKREGIIRSEAVERAMLTVPREEFVWPTDRVRAYDDRPLPLGSTGQTISAPHMVAIMLEASELKEGQVVLEVGCGSGYNAALIAEMIAPSRGRGLGKVVSVERVEALVSFAKENLKRTNYSSVVEVVMGDGSLGYPARHTKPIYDCIMVTAAAPSIPPHLADQLKPDGTALIPVGSAFSQDLIKIRKAKDHTLTQESVCGCVFVPLVGASGY
jgi:protein-L-isoaspartate(D-aspartate) O-methyltransferase